MRKVRKGPHGGLYWPRGTKTSGLVPPALHQYQCWLHWYLLAATTRHPSPKGEQSGSALTSSLGSEQHQVPPRSPRPCLPWFAM